MTSRKPQSGRVASRAKTSASHEWDPGADSGDDNRASFMTLLNSLASVAPNLSSSKTLQHSSLPTMDEISQSSFGRWPTSGMASRGECLTVVLRRPPESLASLHCRISWKHETAGSILFEPECGDRDAEKSGSDGEKLVSPFAVSVGNSKQGYVKKLAHCLYAESARHTGTDWSRNYVSYPEGRVRRLTPLETERLQGFPDSWTMPKEEMPNLDILESARYHACGNAVSVPVAEWLGHRIVANLGEWLVGEQIQKITSKSS